MIFGPVLVPPDEGTLARMPPFCSVTTSCALKQLEMEMTQAKFVLAGLVAGVTLGGLGSGNAEAANVLASSDRGIVIAGNDAEPSGANVISSGQNISGMAWARTIE
jgi:hypothetical protein